MRHQRSWCAAVARGCIFSNVSPDTRLRQPYIFATYIALVKIKNIRPRERRDVVEGPGCEELYRRPRERPLQRSCGVLLFYYHEVRTLRFGACGKKDRLWICSFAWRFQFANIFRKIAKKKIDPLTLSRLFLTNNMYRLFIIKWSNKWRINVTDVIQKIDCLNSAQ